MKHRTARSSGITILEIVVAIAVALVFLVGVNQLLFLGVQASDLSKTRSTAAQLATEGVEAMYNIRQNGAISFTANWTGLTGANEYYQPSLSGNTWSFGSKLTVNPPAVLPSPYTKFTRTVKIEPVHRANVGLGCTGNVLDSGGCIDHNTRKITVTVTWRERGVLRTFNTVSLLTNI